MKGFFHYRFEPANNENICAFLFKPTGYISIESFAEGIESAGIAVPYPDNIVIQCAGREYQELSKSITGSVIEQALKRISKRSRVYLAGYNNKGELAYICSIGKKSDVASTLEFKKYLKMFHQQILQTGLKDIFSRSGVIQIAPSGYTFVKPSGDRSTIFLKTEEALFDSERSQFVAFSLLARLAKRQKNLTTALTTIYIDTMGIASIAYALRDLYWGDKTDGQPFPRIESFHSHAGLDNFETPLQGTSFCLISASQSMRMQTKWKQKTQANDDEVVTLLTIKGVADSESALFATAIINNVGEFSETNALHDIRLVGEQFYPDQIKPRKVLLGTKHQVEEMYSLSSSLHLVDLFKIQVSQGNKIRPLYIDTNAIPDCSNFEFNIWIKNICDQYVPLSIQAVVAQDDQQSIDLAKTIISRLKSEYGINLPNDPVTEESITNGTCTINSDKALLIVAAVIGKGARLLAISRDLRDKHKGARCYIVGFQVAESQNQIKTLKQNLKSPATQSKWDMVVYKALATGNGLGHSFASENRIQVTSIINNDRFLNVYGSANGLVEDTFLPSTVNDQVSFLELRKDFAFWPNIEYEANSRYGPWVFAMIAALLQNARENKTLPLDCQLSTEAYQNVVLDPENFYRYNDGMIQAAILRAALPHELDYSCSSQLSYTVKTMLMKFFESINKPQGEAAFEFALALRTERLKIQKKHYDELIIEITNVYKALDTKTTQMTQLLSILESSMGGDSVTNDTEL